MCARAGYPGVCEGAGCPGGCAGAGYPDGCAATRYSGGCVQEREILACVKERDVLAGVSLIIILCSWGRRNNPCYTEIDADNMSVVRSRSPYIHICSE